MSVAAPAAEAPAGAHYVSYPIHYDGPRVHHGTEVRATRSDLTGGLPTFNLTYHGGPVQTSTTTYSIFWKPKGYRMVTGFTTLINRFLGDVGGSAIYEAAKEYYGSNGRVTNTSRLRDTYVDTATPYPSAGVDDFALQQEVLRVAHDRNWAPGINVQFMIFTANNAPLAHGGGYCAYHSAFEYGLPGQPYVYGFMPYVGTVNGCNEPFGISPNNNPEADGVILNLSHEQTEMVTDPLLNAWADDNNGEVGDICIYSFGVPIDYNTGANIVIRGHGYFLQEEYSQRAHSCQPNL